MSNNNEHVPVSPKPETGSQPLSRSEMLDMHERILDRVRKMTPEEGFHSLVASGIYTPDGRLTKEYGGTQ